VGLSYSTQTMRTISPPRPVIRRDVGTENVTMDGLNGHFAIPPCKFAAGLVSAASTMCVSGAKAPTPADSASRDHSLGSLSRNGTPSSFRHVRARVMRVITVDGS
jgi:hypothetical protein